MAIKYHFEHPEAAALWEHEYMGQISDGMWENTSGTEFWWHGDTVCDGLVGYTADAGEYPRKKGFALSSSELLDIVGDRMLFYVQAVEAGFDWEIVRSLESKYDWERIGNDEKSYYSYNQDKIKAVYDKFFGNRSDVLTYIERHCKSHTLTDIKPYIAECIQMIHTPNPTQGSSVKPKFNTENTYTTTGSSGSLNYGNKYVPDTKDLKRAEDLYKKPDPVRAAELMAAKITDHDKMMRRARAMEIVGNKLYPNKVKAVMDVWKKYAASFSFGNDTAYRS